MTQNFVNKILIAFIVVLLAGNIYLAYQHRKISVTVNHILELQQTNGKILAFSRLFSERILKAERELDTNGIIELSNAAKDTGDAEIQNEWAKFLESKTPEEAQRQAQHLLEILLKKMKLE